MDRAAAFGIYNAFGPVDVAVGIHRFNDVVLVCRKAIAHQDEKQDTKKGDFIKGSRAHNDLRKMPDVQRSFGQSPLKKATLAVLHETRFCQGIR